MFHVHITSMTKNNVLVAYSSTSTTTSVVCFSSTVPGTSRSLSRVIFKYGAFFDRKKSFTRSKSSTTHIVLLVLLLLLPGEAAYFYCTNPQQKSNGCTSLLKSPTSTQQHCELSVKPQFSWLSTKQEK